MLEIGLPRLRMSRSFLQDLSRAVSRFSRAQLQEITASAFSNTIAFPDRIEKTIFRMQWTIVIVFEPVGSHVDFLQLGP